MPGADLELKFARLTENAFPPTKGSEKAAGYDLKSVDIFFESAVISLRYLLISSETAELQSLFFSLTICSTLVSSSSLVNMLSTTS
uniref:SFRICE_002313 n=1 Tax=Spodoptera frugiperda TaxID=7108 RepID=A0A2H1WEN2_SPOFR